jgi:hypothetical protein
MNEVNQNGTPLRADEKECDDPMLRLQRIETG